MTTMDSDSESQDSDDGRRFRFEATRKDAAKDAHVESSDKSSKSPRKKTKHKSRTHRDRKDKSKYESGGRKESRASKERDSAKDGDKDLRHVIKQSRGVKHEDAKDRTRESKRYRARDRDRDRHHKQRSRERSHDRNHEEQSSTGDKHRSGGGGGGGCRDRLKYHSHSNKSRDRSSNKLRSPDIRHESGRRAKSGEAKTPEASHQQPPKRNDSRQSNERAAADSQECKDIDLSDYDVLSETDENMSDASDSRSRSPSLRCHKSKIKKRDPEEESGAPMRERRALNSERRPEEALHKVNPGRGWPTPPSAAGNNNPGAVSDFLLAPAPTATPATARECVSNDKERAGRCGTGRDDLSRDEDAECVENIEKPDSSRSLADGSAYGPALPPQLAKNDSNAPPPLNPPDAADVEGKDNQDGGGRLSADEDERSSFVDDVTFGPALPPHLMRKSQDRVIGPAMMPDDAMRTTADRESSESEDGDAIGPLPLDHPALRSSVVHERLEQRARRIKDRLLEETESASKREDWMTKLPSAQASNLGLAARKFRVTPGPDMSDRSCWTDTPAQKALKLKEQALKGPSNTEPEGIPAREVPKEDSGSRKREKSLLEVHQEKLRKKKKKEEKEATSEDRTYRRPFDRDIDLQANRLDRVQKKAIFMKAQLLNDRFSRGEI